ncbi:MAG: hypothetical protein AB2375_07040 [Tissierellaceae bacterium]
MKNYIIYRCKICGCEFILPKQYVRINESRGDYIACPYGGHKQIIVVGAYDYVKECMQNDSFKRENRRMKQRS